jgi:hypothetical protein
MVFQQTNIFKAAPFDQADQIYTQAFRLQSQTLEQLWQQRQEHLRQKLEREWELENPEQSYESNALEQGKERPNFQEQAHRAGLKALEGWGKENQQGLRRALPLAQQWFARRGEHGLVVVEGQIDPKLTAREIFQHFKSADDRGLWLWTQLDTRSLWLQAQYKDPDRQWCALVPTIMYAFKSLHRVPYSRWSRQNLHWVVNKNLCDAMLCDMPIIARDELLEIREYGLKVKTGAKAGEARKPETSYKLWGINDSRVRELPELAQVMLAQLWCAHPENRTKYMILDPKNWDEIPQALVDQEIFAPESTNTPSWNNSGDFPWQPTLAQKAVVNKPAITDLPWN